MLKIAIGGKGGAGKTTLAALWAHILVERGHSVFAVDTDPSANLAMAIGMPMEMQQKIITISKQKELIEDRTGAAPGTHGAMSRVNPRVDDIPDRCNMVCNGIKFIRFNMLDLTEPGHMCPESVLMRAIISNLLFNRKEDVIIDMSPGIGYFGKANAGALDAFLILAEPGFRSLAIGNRIGLLAANIGIQHIYLIGNKNQNGADRLFIEINRGILPLIGQLSYSPEAIQADKNTTAVWETAPDLLEEARQLLDKLIEQLQPKS